MKQTRVYQVYGILDKEGAVLYVGLTINPPSRFKDHTQRKPNSTLSHGRFYGRTDLHYEVFSNWKTRKEGRIEEDKLRVQYGFESEKEQVRTRQLSRKNWPKLTEEHKEKIRQSKIGKKRKPFSEEWKKKLGDATRGKKRVFSEEWKINISKGRRKQKES